MKQQIELAVAVIVIIIAVIGVIKWLKNNVGTVNCDECPSEYCGGCKAVCIKRGKNN